MLWLCFTSHCKTRPAFKTVAVVTTGVVYTAVTTFCSARVLYPTAAHNLGNETGWSTVPSLLWVAPSRAVSLGEYCGRPEAYPENGSNGLVRGLTVIWVSRTALGFVGDELRNNLTTDSIICYIYINIHVGSLVETMFLQSHSYANL